MISCQLRLSRTACRRRPRSLYAKTLNLLVLIGPPPAPALTFNRYNIEESVKGRQLARHRSGGADLAERDATPQEKKVSTFVSLPGTQDSLTA